MELDHVFVFIAPDGPEIEAFRALGLVESYRRKHPGQGTENVCYGFDNLYVELLWVNDPNEITSAPIARTKLFERSRWRTDGTNPFGISWRGGAAPFPVWDFRPPYLPEGMAIDVAVDSDDPRLPMMFRSPGNSAPVDWPAERRGDLQHRAGLADILSIRLDLPAGVASGTALTALAAATGLEIGTSAHDRARMSLSIRRLSGGEPLVIDLPLGL